VRFTRAVAVLGALFYVFLWVLAANGVTSLVAPLLIPVVLAVLVAAGVALNRFMGITPRSQHFKDHDDESHR
jgi:Mg2+/citrate symporter